jgi:hypothetical protein
MRVVESFFIQLIQTHNYWFSGNNNYEKNKTKNGV